MPTLRPILTALALCAALALAGCGSGSATTSGSATLAAPAAGPKRPGHPASSAPATGTEAAGGAQGRGAGAGASTEPEPTFHPRPHHDSGGGAGQFEEAGGDNSIARFGAEAGAGDLAAAAAVLHEYLDARAEGAWAIACSRLAPAIAKGLGALAGGTSGPCPKLLAALSAGLPPQALEEAAVADVGALRSHGGRAFLLYTGAHGVHYFVPMAKEGGRWKLAAIAPSTLP